MTDPVTPLPGSQMGKTEVLVTVAPYALVLVVWAVFIICGAGLSTDAKEMGHDLFSILLILINPAKQFAQYRRKTPK